MGFDLYSTKNDKYFRNNVWWWRRLASYVIDKTKVVDEDKADGWHFNDGHEVSREEAHQIANQLEFLIKTGDAKAYEDEVKKEMEEAEKHNQRVEKLLQQLQKRVIADTRCDTDVVPRDYPEPYRTKWEKIYGLRRIESNYPFSVSNVKEFIKFCRESDGFRIC